MPDPPYAFCIHQAPKRIRLKIPSKKGKEDYFVSLKDKMSTVEGIINIKTNPITGSVVFLHSCDFREIVNYAESQNLFRVITTQHSVTPINEKISNVFISVNNKITQITTGYLDLRTLIFLSLMGAGIYQIIRGNLLIPAWYTAFWYAFNILKSKN